MAAVIGKLGKIRSHLIIIVGVLAIAGLAAAAFLFYENSNLSSQTADLTSSYSNLQVQDNLLNSSFSSLQSSYSGLQSNYNALESNLSSTLSAQSDLLAEYNMLNSKYTTLNSNYASLQANYTALQSNYTLILNNYNSLQSLVPSSKGITIDAISWNRGNMTNAGITNIYVRNLGTTVLHVVSLKLFYNDILQSSVSLDFALPPGNVTEDISVFLPPATYNYNDIYTLKVMTLEGYNATSDPLPLCQ
jgi:hypothetical protein